MVSSWEEPQNVRYLSSLADVDPSDLHQEWEGYFRHSFATVVCVVVATGEVCHHVLVGVNLADRLNALSLSVALEKPT